MAREIDVYKALIGAGYIKKALRRLGDTDIEDASIEDITILQTGKEYLLSSVSGSSSFERKTYSLDGRIVALLEVLKVLESNNVVSSIVEDCILEALSNRIENLVEYAGDGPKKIPGIKVIDSKKK